MEIPDLDDPRMLRNVSIKGTPWRVKTWDTGKRYPTGQRIIGYAFYDDSESAEPIFTGEDCGVAPHNSIDSDAAIVGLLSFLSLRPGDTDKDYFKDYTE